MKATRFHLESIPGYMRMASWMLVLIILLLAIPAVGQVDQPNQKQPLLVILNPNDQLGLVLEGAPVKHSLRLANRGSSPLEIVRLRPWKGSQVIRFDRKIAPGAEGSIDLELKTLGAGQHPLRGVTFLTNEIGPHTHRMKVDLQVTPQIQVIPDRADLSGLAGHQIQREIRIGGNLDMPLKLTVPISDLPPAVSFDLNPAGAPGGFRLMVRVRSDKAGVIRGRIRFSTNYPQKPFIIVPVMARFLDVVQAVPHRLDFGTVLRQHFTAGSSTAEDQRGIMPIQDNPQAAVFVRLNRAGRFTVQKAIIDDRSAGFATKVTPVDAGRLYRVDVTARVNSLPDGKVEDALRIIFDGSIPAIRVPLHIVVY